jgi:hypothetical protein
MSNEKTTSQYYYDKGALDFRDQLLSSLLNYPVGPEVKWAEDFIRQNYPIGVVDRVFQ